MWGYGINSTKKTDIRNLVKIFQDFHYLVEIFTIWPRFSSFGQDFQYAEIFTIWLRFSRFGQDFDDLAENFKRPKNREDSSDLDEKLSESIVALQTII